MKKLLFSSAVFLWTLGAWAQNTLQVTVQDSGTAAPGVAVFYYSSPSQFLNGGNYLNPDFGNYDAWAYSNPNGVASFTINNTSVLDTVYWATKDCSGNWIWGGGTANSSTNLNINGTLWLTCLPGVCDAYTAIQYDSVNTLLTGNAVILRDSSYLSSIPGNPVIEWTFPGSNQLPVNGTSFSVPGINLSSNNATVCFQVYANCIAICDSLALGSSGGSGGGGTSVSCNPFFSLTNLGQDSVGYRVLVSDSSSTNGTIIGYSLDMGDGTVLNSTTRLSSHNHAYSNPGVYAVCLTITSALGADTCRATYCDSVLVPGSGSNPNPLSCNASYLVDTINSLTFQGQIVLWESSSVSNGTIVDWFWDFGDGTTINTRYPIHTYAQNSGAFPICLTITAIDSAGTDTCVSTFCDTVGVDSLGNLIFKGQQGLTVNVIDPATVGIDEISAADFRLFPNPARQSATLQWEAATEVNLVEVYSLNGQLQQQIEPEGQELKFSNLASGTYIVRVQTAQTSISLKLQVH